MKKWDLEKTDLEINGAISWAAGNEHGAIRQLRMDIAML